VKPPARSRATSAISANFEVSRRQYHKLLEAALAVEADFTALPIERPITGADALARAMARSG